MDTITVDHVECPNRMDWAGCLTFPGGSLHFWPNAVAVSSMSMISPSTSAATGRTPTSPTGRRRVPFPPFPQTQKASHLKQLEKFRGFRFSLLTKWDWRYCSSNLWSLVGCSPGSRLGLGTRSSVASCSRCWGSMMRKVRQWASRCSWPSSSTFPPRRWWLRWLNLQLSKQKVP